ncbi:MAG: YCF48-related protein [Pyrinomonadaceae bacterium]
MFRIQRYFKAAFFIFATAAFASGQNNWYPKEPISSKDLVAVYFTSSERGWIAGDNGLIASTDDSGRTWKKYPLNATKGINEIYFRNNDNGYLVAGRKMFVTKDGGLSWNETIIFDPADFKDSSPEFLSIRFADKKRGVVIGSVQNRDENVIDSLVMKTEDGGVTWQRIFVPSKKELYHLDFVGESRCWIVGDGGLILASVDGGSTFQVQRSGTGRSLYNVDFRDQDKGYAVGSKGVILRTENGGRGWESVTTGYADSLMRVDFADDKNGWIVGYHGMILRSSDRGRTWSKQNGKTVENLYGLFMDRKFGWAVGAKGTMIEYRK